MMMNTRTRNLFLLHLIVLIFGFTGILGKEINLTAEPLVFWRMLIAFLAILGFGWWKGEHTRKLPKGALPKMLLIGTLIAAHWITFFAAIKLSNVSVALACLASTSLFVAIVEPIITRKKAVWYELLLGIAVILGLGIIFKAETQYTMGILLALLSALLAATFAVLNSVEVKKYDSTAISLYEMGFGATMVALYLVISGGLEAQSIPNTGIDWLWLILLGTIATAFAFVVSVDIMKELSAFTVSLTINLEPIYSIVLALLIYGEEEQMSGPFYLGALIILSTLFVNAWLKRLNRKRAANVKSLSLQ